MLTDTLCMCLDAMICFFWFVSWWYQSQPNICILAIYIYLVVLNLISAIWSFIVVSTRLLLCINACNVVLMMQIAIPVVPTVRVVITFTKFVELPPTELFYTPLSSPRHLSNVTSAPEEEKNRSTSTSSTSWLRRSNSNRVSSKPQQQCPEALISDPFAIPSGYSWESIDSKNRKMKKSKSVRKAK